MVKFDEITFVPVRTFVLALAFLILSFPAAAQERAGFSGELPDKEMLDISVPLPQTPALPGPEKAMRDTGTAKSAGADMSEFYRRLESIGLDTRELRSVSSRIKVVFGGQSADAAAEYGYILNRLHIPIDFSEEGAGRVRFDLAGYDISTLIHEYVHAAMDVSADPAAPKGTPAREHYDAVHVIQADLRSQAFFYRYSWMKADEVSAYFMGDAVNIVFDAVNDVIIYNTMFKGGKPSTVAEAERLGGRFILPSPSDALNNWERNLLRSYARFGQNSVYDSAQFMDNVITGFVYIHWPERQFIKDDMYGHILGLNPPKTLQELVDRLNTVDNDWIRDVRRKTAAKRLENALKAEALAAGKP